jgi:CMP-N-acetylneuraminic acid synthetase
MINIAIIPVRKNSKRLKNKNILDFNGHMLFEHTLIAVLKSQCYNKIIVTTDIKLPNKILNRYAKKVIFHKRPQKYCTDRSKALEVVNYYFKKFSLEKEKYGTISLLLATCPLRDANDIKKAFAILKQNKKADGIISITDYGFPYKMSLNKNSRSFIKPYWKNSPLITGNTRSQNHKPVFRPNGGFYIQYLDKFRNNKNFFKGNIMGHYMPLEKSIDVDNFTQFKIAKFLDQQ